jgi:hypothetical protein
MLRRPEQSVMPSFPALICATHRRCDHSSRADSGFRRLAERRLLPLALFALLVAAARAQTDAAQSADSASAAPPVQALVRDWDGNGIDTAGLYEPATGKFFLRNSNTSGAADLVFAFGGIGATLVAVSGDWNGDGVDTIAVVDTSTGVWALKNSNATGGADITFTYNPGGTHPLSGDWNGDGIDTAGSYNPATGQFFLRNSNTGGAPDLTLTFGATGSQLPLAGDWNNDGFDTIGVADASTGTRSLRNSNTSGPADLVFAFAPGKFPLAGDWNGDGIATAGAFTPSTSTFFLRNSNTSGNADLVFTLLGPEIFYDGFDTVAIAALEPFGNQVVGKKNGDRFTYSPSNRGKLTWHRFASLREFRVRSRSRTRVH